MTEIRVRRDIIVRAMVSLSAAISLLEKSDKKAAPSDKMFDQMIKDYKSALATARVEILNAQD